MISSWWQDQSSSLHWLVRLRIFHWKSLNLTSHLRFCFFFFTVEGSSQGSLFIHKLLPLYHKPENSFNIRHNYTIIYIQLLHKHAGPIKCFRQRIKSCMLQKCGQTLTTHTDTYIILCCKLGYAIFNDFSEVNVNIQGLLKGVASPEPLWSPTTCAARMENVTRQQWKQTLVSHQHENAKVTKKIKCEPIRITQKKRHGCSARRGGKGQSVSCESDSEQKGISVKQHHTGHPVWSLMRLVFMKIRFPVAYQSVFPHNK